MEYSVQTLKQEWVTTRGVALEDFLLLVLHVTKKNRTDFFRETEPVLTEEQYRTLISLLERRAQNEPLAYLTGKKEFFGRNFLVNPSTLIPRPDSECLLEDVLFFEKNIRTPDYIFDIGTGSGALAITLRKELPDTALKVLASDVSEEALAVAKENASVLGADVTFLTGPFLTPYQTLSFTGKHIYIIANLPYLSEELLAQAAPDVKDYEPITALLSADHGTAHYIQLFNELKKCAGLHGFCWIEISPEQSSLLTEKVKHVFPAAEIFIGKDLAQRSRFIRFSL